MYILINKKKPICINVGEDNFILKKNFSINLEDSKYNLIENKIKLERKLTIIHVEDIESFKNKVEMYLDNSNPKLIQHYIDSKIERVRINIMLEMYKKEEFIKEWIFSRGLNLVTNGLSSLRDNTNFSSFEFDPIETFSGKGSFSHNKSFLNTNDEIIPVDSNQTYELSLMAKGEQLDGIGPNTYVGICCYDADDKFISPQHHMRYTNTDTALAYDLRIGDTKVYLEDVSNFQNKNKVYQRGLTFWHYKNEKGYTYPSYTYSRWSWDDLWSSGANIDYEENSIDIYPFSNPNPNDPEGTWRAGHKVSNRQSGGTYKYTTIVSKKLNLEWTRYEGISAGIDYSGLNKKNKFAPGTSGVKIIFLNSYEDRRGLRYYYSNIIFKIAKNKFIADGVNDNIEFLNKQGKKVANLSLETGNLNCNKIITNS